MFRQLTRRSVVFLTVAVIWMAVVSMLMFGIPAKVRADEEAGWECPKASGGCYWSNCMANMDAQGNILSRTCTGRKFTGGSCDEANCVQKDNFLE